MGLGHGFSIPFSMERFYSYFSISTSKCISKRGTLLTPRRRNQPPTTYSSRKTRSCSKRKMLEVCKLYLIFFPEYNYNIPMYISVFVKSGPDISRQLCCTVSIHISWKSSQMNPNSVEIFQCRARIIAIKTQLISQLQNARQRYSAT